MKTHKRLLDLLGFMADMVVGFLDHTYVISLNTVWGMFCAKAEKNDVARIPGFRLTNSICMIPLSLVV